MNCLHMDHLVLATHHTEYCTCSGICSIPCPRKSALLKIEFFTAYRACSHISLLACSLRCILDHVVHDNSRRQNFLDQCHSHPSRTDCLYRGPWMLLHLVLVRYNTLCGGQGVPQQTGEEADAITKGEATARKSGGRDTTSR